MSGLPPIFPAASASGEVTSLLGTSPLRFYRFGRVPQGTPYPYAVWQLTTGTPENYLAGAPDIDSLSVQVDVYSRDPNQALDCAIALRDAIELNAHITLWRGEEVDPETKSFRVGFVCDWWVSRDGAPGFLLEGYGRLLLE